MVDTEGPVEVASHRADGQRGEDRKVDQIVCELERYDIVVGALQETKLFGREVYKVNGSVVLWVQEECVGWQDSEGEEV